jgi:methyltransferase-like protein/SAM-dependent methyltransferase
MSSYDEIPYDSQPIRETHPANLALQARLFGLVPAPAERCRVLELGCATGGNLIPMAYHLPESEFLGIELSAGQVASAQRLIEALGLANLRVLQADLAACDPATLGQFDYIIAHGLYSWIPAPVRAKLWALCAHCLAPHGVVYISYNTYPGWHLRAILRELLLFGLRDSPGPAAARLARAQALLARCEAIFGARQDALARRLAEEAAALRQRDPAYLYHEYLEETNAPVHFSEFMAEAERYGLQYLCESELQSMFPEPLGEQAVALVDSFEDLIAQEQMMDFLRLRTFRQTLLCRAEIELERELDLALFAGFAYYALLEPREPPDFNQPRSQPYASPEGQLCYVEHPLTKAALAVLAEAYPDALGFETLAEAAATRCRAAGAATAGTPPSPPLAASERERLLGELTGLYFRQFVGISERPRAFDRALSERPCASRLARVYAAAGLGHVPVLWHMPMTLDAFAMRLLACLDGTRRREELVNLLTDEIAAGRLVLEVPVPSQAAALREAVADNVERLLASFARHGLLVPQPENETHI